MRTGSRASRKGRFHKPTFRDYLATEGRPLVGAISIAEQAAGLPYGPSRGNFVALGE